MTQGKGVATYDMIRQPIQAMAVSRSIDSNNRRSLTLFGQLGFASLIYSDAYANQTQFYLLFNCAAECTTSLHYYCCTTDFGLRTAEHPYAPTPRQHTVQPANAAPPVLIHIPGDSFDGNGALLQQVVSFDLPQGFYAHNARVTTKPATRGFEGAENFAAGLTVVHSQEPAGAETGVGPVGRLSSKLSKVR